MFEEKSAPTARRAQAGERLGEHKNSALASVPALGASASAVVAGSMFVLNGKHRAVLISYPTRPAGSARYSSCRTSPQQT